MEKQKIQTFRETRKYNLWVKYFTDQKNKKTWLNATQSAIEAYGYTKPEQYHLASTTGSKNMRKYEFLAVSTLDMMGFGFGDLLKIGLKKAMEGSFKDWDAFMVRLGYFNEKESKVQQIQINKFEFSNLQEAIALSRKERGLDP